MDIIEESLDRLIVRIKDNMGYFAPKFIKAYKSQNIDNPIKDYLIVAGIDDLQIEKEFIGDVIGENMMVGKEYKAIAQFRVYAPMGSNGNGLSELASMLCCAVEHCDTEKLVEQVKMSSIEYDTNLRAVYRTISATLAFYLCEEVTI